MTFVEDLSTHETSVGKLYPTEDGLWSGTYWQAVLKRARTLDWYTLTRPMLTPDSVYG